MSKKLIAVVMGGPSMEHEVSLNSGAAMVANLDREKYDIVKVVVTKSSQWIIDDGQPKSAISALETLAKVDVALLALHGTFGEDGTIQALFANKGIKYSGSDAAASLLAIDKSMSNTLYEVGSLPVPRWSIYSTKDEETAREIAENYQLPFVVKPNRQGSSVGVSIVKEQNEILPALQKALQFDTSYLVQDFVRGREISCGLLEDPVTKQVTALPPTELIPTNSEFFDYEAKYSKGGATEVTPPDMPADIIARIQDYAVQSHKILGCYGYSRTDMFVTESEIYLIETNTLPGMTETSILPQQAAAAGISFPELLDKMVESALNR